MTTNEKTYSSRPTSDVLPQCHNCGAVLHSPGLCPECGGEVGYPVSEGELEQSDFEAWLEDVEAGLEYPERRG